MGNTHLRMAGNLLDGTIQFQMIDSHSLTLILVNQYHIQDLRVKKKKSTAHVDNKEERSGFTTFFFMRKK